MFSLNAHDDWQRSEQSLRQAAHAGGSFLNEARTYMKSIEGRYGLDSPTVRHWITRHLFLSPCFTRNSRIVEKIFSVSSRVNPPCLPPGMVRS